MTIPDIKDTSSAGEDLTNEQLNIWLCENLCVMRVFRPSEVKYRSSYAQESYGTDASLYVLPKKKRPQTHMIDAVPLPNFCENLSHTFQLVERMRKAWYERNSEETDYIKIIDCCEHGWFVEVNWGHHDGDITEATARNESLARAICEAIYQAEKQ